MRTMYDSITASDIPAGVPMVAGYIDGTFCWSAADWALHANAVQVRIATRADVNDGHVLDVESGDATPDQAPGWATMRRGAGQDPTIYCGESSWAAVQDAFTAAGVGQPHYWIAAYPGGGSTDLPTLNGITAVAHQWINDPGSGGHYDLSCVADVWPGVDTNPAPTQTPAAPTGPVFGEEYDMLPKQYPPVPVVKDAAGNASQVAYDALEWDGRAAVLNVIALDDNCPVFVHQLANWGPHGGTGGGVPEAGTNPPGAGTNAWRVDPNLPVALTVPADTTRVFLSYSSNGRTEVQIVPTA